MSLPPSKVAREALHTRTITVNSFAREDGLWDLEAELIDVKAYDFPKKNGSIHAAGSPVHHMHLRVTINEDFTITDTVASYDAAPYGEHCTVIASDYSGLIGLNLLRRFRNAVRERFSRTAGCTHMTELSQILPTVAVQTMSNKRRKAAATTEPGRRPFQLEGCHALRLDGPVAKQHFPIWYVEPQNAEG